MQAMFMELLPSLILLPILGVLVVFIYMGCRIGFLHIKKLKQKA